MPREQQRRKSRNLVDNQQNVPAGVFCFMRRTLLHDSCLSKPAGRESSRILVSVDGERGNHAGKFMRCSKSVLNMRTWCASSAGFEFSSLWSTQQNMKATMRGSRCYPRFHEVRPARKVFVISGHVSCWVERVVLLFAK